MSTALSICFVKEVTDAVDEAHVYFSTKTKPLYINY